jgi:hypothetical protein
VFTNAEDFDTWFNVSGDSEQQDNVIRKLHTVRTVIYSRPATVTPYNISLMCSAMCIHALAKQLTYSVKVYAYSCQELVRFKQHCM